jgi:hypothetical protein
MIALIGALSLAVMLLFLLVGILAALRKTGKAKKMFFISACGLVLFIVMIVITPSNYGQISASKPVQHKVAEKKQSPQEVEKQKAAKAKAKAEQASKAKAKAKAEEEAKTKEMLKKVHLNGIQGLPRFKVDKYSKGQTFPALNGNTMPCNWQTCYRVEFDVKGLTNETVTKGEHWYSPLKETGQYSTNYKSIKAKLMKGYSEQTGLTPGEVYTDEANVEVAYFTNDNFLLKLKFFKE